MGLYNILHGRNPLAEFYLAVLGLGAVPRLRDVWLDEDGRKIVVFTRLGGGNRECHCERAEIEKNEHSCYQAAIKGLQSHPQYLRDWDDGYDSTYAYFEFTVPDEYFSQLVGIVEEIAKR